MSAESLAPPIFIYKDQGDEFIAWGNCNTDEKAYYLRLLNDETTFEDYLEDLHLLELRRFEAWQRDPSLDEEE